VGGLGKEACLFFAYPVPHCSTLVMLSCSRPFSHASSSCLFVPSASYAPVGGVLTPAWRTSTLPWWDSSAAAVRCDIRREYAMRVIEVALVFPDPVSVRVSMQSSFGGCECDVLFDINDSLVG